MLINKIKRVERLKGFCERLTYLLTFSPQAFAKVYAAETSSEVYQDNQLTLLMLPKGIAAGYSCRVAEFKKQTVKGN